MVGKRKSLDGRLGLQTYCQIDCQQSHFVGTFRLACLQGQWQPVWNGQHERYTGQIRQKEMITSSINHQIFIKAHHSYFIYIIYEACQKHQLLLLTNGQADQL